MTKAQAITVLNPIEINIQPLTAWEFNADKWRAMEDFDKYYEEWAKTRTQLFPNWHLLNPIYDATAYSALTTWEMANPSPMAPFCRHCGSDFHPQEKRWCCNPECTRYLS